MAPQGPASAGRAEQSAESLRARGTNARPLPRHDLPARQTNFIGRALELSELTELLVSPNCRLVTVIGPGGIGKTRLAIEAADAVRERFADGIAFVSLLSVTPTEPIAPVIASEIGCSLSGQVDARDQVARFLRSEQKLLIMDNFEHLLGESLWLGELLAEAQRLRVLVTSREALNLSEEWRYPLAGLMVPAGDVNDAGQSDAVRLFVERAQQVRPDFSFEMERDGVLQLCRITEGLPLALELAAAWVKTLSCTAIADEIESNIAFLATGLRNVPARHRSMQAAFDHSWALLIDDERHVFQRLAVFRGGFSREAAEQVAEATLPLLSSLLDKSLVRRDLDGRFQLHDLLRQYADERLHASPEYASRASAAHRAYYLGFVINRFNSITGGAQREAITEIASELDNIRAAWHGAAVAGDIEAIAQAAHTMTLFFDFRALYREGLALLEEGLQALRAAAPFPDVDRAIAAMLIDIVRLNHRLAQLPAMRTALEEAEARYARLSGPPPPGQMTDPSLWRALLFLVDGGYSDAARLSAEAIERNLVNERPGNLPFAWWVRAAANLWQEDTDAAGEYAQRCSDAARAVGDRWILAYGHNLQGHVAVAREDYADARHHYQASYDIREELGDPEGTCTGLTHLARVAVLEGDLEEAELLYHRSLEIAGSVGDNITTANALNGMGMMACSAGDFARAGQHFADGLSLMAEVRMMRLLLTFLASTGDWLLQTGRPAEAAGPLAIAEAHPASDRDTRARARRMLTAVANVLPSEEYAAIVEQSRDADPARMATTLIPLLTAPLATTQTGPARTEPWTEATPTPATPTAAGTLIESLTARELAVLRLIAAGHTNREIADELFLSENTIRSYSHQLYSKLGVGSRTQALARARELGLLP